jgi:hypothetical protein
MEQQGARVISFFPSVNLMHSMLGARGGRGRHLPLLTLASWEFLSDILQYAATGSTKTTLIQPLACFYQESLPVSWLRCPSSPSRNLCPCLFTVNSPGYARPFESGFSYCMLNC